MILKCITDSHSNNVTSFKIKIARALCVLGLYSIRSTAHFIVVMVGAGFIFLLKFEKHGWCRLDRLFQWLSQR